MMRACGLERRRRQSMIRFSKRFTFFNEDSGCISKGTGRNGRKLSVSTNARRVLASMQNTARRESYSTLLPRLNTESRLHEPWRALVFVESILCSPMLPNESRSRLSSCYIAAHDHVRCRSNEDTRHTCVTPMTAPSSFVHIDRAISCSSELG